MAWLERLDDRTDLQLLIPQYETVVSIANEEDQICLLLMKDKCSNVEEPSKLPDLSIEGNTHSIHQLLSGREMLQNLFKRQELIVKGRYRTILLFESLCWLNKV